MVRLESETNLEVLRQAGLLLNRENQKLWERLRQLTLENARLRGVAAGDVAQLELTLAEELKKVREAILRPPEPPRSDKAPPGESPPTRGHGPRRQPELRVVERVHQLPAQARECELCGGELAEMKGQFEPSEEVSLVQRSVELVVHLRQKYRCECNGNVVTAPGPPKLIPGGRYAPEFAVEVAVGKYLDHLPLERQVRMLAREGLEVDSQTLWDQIHALSRHLEPTYEALIQRVMASPVIHVDESGWPLLGRRGPSPGSVWSVSSVDTVVYRMLESKSLESGRTVLGDYCGIVVADGYAVYPALSRASPGFRLAHCWAHVKRKFSEAAENFPVACSEILGRIRELYDVERLVPGAFPGDAAAQQLRRRLREERTGPLLEKIRQWAFSQVGLPRSEFGQAIHYMLERWKGLTLFLTEPLVPLDNNAAERALRGPVLGRKNHYGSRSKRGTQVAGILYSLCETAKLCAVEPRGYLLQAVLAAIRSPGTVTLPETILTLPKE